MALQTKTIIGDTVHANWDFKLEVVENSTSISDNSSNLTVYAYIGRNGSASYISNGAIDVTVRVSGCEPQHITGRYTTGTIPVGGWYSLGGTTFTVPHGDDGNRTVQISATFTNTFSPSSGWAGTDENNPATMDLTYIPRAALLNSAPNFVDIADPTIYYTNPAGEVAKIEACIADTEGNVQYVKYREIPYNETEYTFFLTDEERETLINAIPDGTTEVYVNFYIKTTINDSLVDTPRSLTRIFSVVDAEPEIVPAVRDIGSYSVGTLTKNDKAMIKGFNHMFATMSVKLKKGATIKSQTIQNGGIIKNGPTAEFPSSESNLFIFSLTDSFGQTITAPFAVDMIQYVKLTCNLTTTIPTADGEMAVKINGNYFNDDFGITNIFDGALEKGMFSATGEKADAAQDLYRSVNPSPIEPNTTYVISVNGVAQRFMVFFYDTDNTFISYTQSNTDGTFTSPENANYLNFRCLTDNYVSDYNNLNVRVEKGTSPSTINTLSVKWRIKENNNEYGAWTDTIAVINGNSYESIFDITGLNYQSSYTVQAIAIDMINTGGIPSVERVVRTVPIFNWGENNFNINVPCTIESSMNVKGNMDLLGDISIKGSILESKNIFDGTLESGSYNSRTGYKTNVDGQYRNKYPVVVEPNTIYVISVNGVAQKFVFLYYDENGAFLSEDRNNTTGIFTTPEGAKYLNFRTFANDYNEDFVNLKVQIEPGDTVTEYIEQKKYGFKPRNIVDLIYPIGSIYMSVNDIDPGVIFGGTWEQIKDKFLLASGSTYSNGTTGGNATHNHDSGDLAAAIGAVNGDAGSIGYIATTAKDHGTASYQIRTNYGSGGTFNHYTPVYGYTGESSSIPPYLAVNIWKRTS